MPGSHKRKKFKPLLRVLFLQWGAHCFVMTTVFQAFFTNFLAQQDTGNRITSVEEILKSGLEYGYTSTFEKYVRDIQDSSHTKIQNHPSICSIYTSCVERVITIDFATTSSACLVDYIPTTKMSSGLIFPYVLSHNVAVCRVSMCLSKGSPLLNPINQIKRRLTESGLADGFFRDYSNVSMREFGHCLIYRKDMPTM